MLKIQGTVMGVKTEIISGTQGKPDFEKHFVGFEVEKSGGFDGEVVVEKVQVSRAQYNNGLMAKYENLKGQIVEVDCFVVAFRTREGAGYQLYLSGDGKPRGVKAV